MATLTAPRPGQVHEVLDKIRTFSDMVRNGEWLGATGEPLTDVVAIGIGGRCADVWSAWCLVYGSTKTCQRRKRRMSRPRSRVATILCHL